MAASTSTWQQIKTFPKSARLFLLATIINGIIFSTWQLFFNFFILARGFEKDFLGLINSVPWIAGLVLGIPLGMLSDRIGRKPAMLIGLAMSITGMGLQLFVQSKVLLILVAFIGGTGNSLYFISQAPFMMKVSQTDNRALMFSLNFGLSTLAGALGNMFAGQMPGWFGILLRIPADSAQAFQSVLLVSVILGLFALIPISLLKEPKKIDNHLIKSNQWDLLKQTMQKGFTWKLVLPEMLLGFGAAITIPYMNLYFSETFQVNSNLLGVVFSLSALFVGIGSIIGPRLVKFFNSKIRVVVLTQASSIIFLLILGFSPYLWLAVVGFLLRGVLMNMAVPLYNAFCMENVAEHEQGVVNSLISNAWTAGWAIGPFLSGLIQIRYGFQPLFLITASIYCLSILSTWVFFSKYEKNLLENNSKLAMDQV
ncbi:MAG: MFS transporter [Anaerolineaceae bacterium]|nr:MFS transporter [Anaerolineaceae bacterium]